jgi:hypothetical protein
LFATPVPTVTGTPGQPSITASPEPGTLVWGDNNCSGAADPVDSLLALRHNAALSTNTGDCPPMGTDLDVVIASTFAWGDVDCEGGISPVDSLKTLRYDAGLSVSQPQTCPAIGSQIQVVD